MPKWFKRLFRRRIIIILLLLLQVLFFIAFVVNTSRKLEWISWALTGISLYIAVYIISRHDKPAFRMTWVFLILAFPIFGGLFYLLWEFQKTGGKLARRYHQIEQKNRPLFFRDGAILAGACFRKPRYAPNLKYLQNHAGFALSDSTEAEYLPSGERKLEVMLAEMEKAKKYIFLEYFTIREGVMWGAVLDVLTRKAAAGVTVRVIYDDFGCFLKLPSDYPQTLKKLGIDCVVFSKFRPIFTSEQNNRDHRKIVVIDGKVAITGGVNISDEYINQAHTSRFIHWKDASIVLRGPAAWSFSVMFLEMWSLAANTDEDFMEFYPYIGFPPSASSNLTSELGTEVLPIAKSSYDTAKARQTTAITDAVTDKTNAVTDKTKINNSRFGFVLPYADSPTDRENVGEHVYLQILGNARRYVYITTPYLIIDDSMISALILAAKSNVDVRIITPGVPDRRFVHATTRSYYRELLLGGVRIFEYEGFIHSKTFVSDDSVATVGTTNLDFRSLYLHFECGVWLGENQCVTDIYDDYIKTLKRCREITLTDCKMNIISRLGSEILRLYAPLM